MYINKVENILYNYECQYVIHKCDQLATTCDLNAAGKAKGAFHSMPSFLIILPFTRLKLNPGVRFRETVFLIFRQLPSSKLTEYEKNV